MQFIISSDNDAVSLLEVALEDPVKAVELEMVIKNTLLII
jgi:hypothetical protein